MRLGYSNNVEYALISEALGGRVVIPEPINFDDGIRNIYERDSDSKGFLKTKSNSLEFHNQAKDNLIFQKAVRGVAEDIILQRNVKHKYRLDERLRTVTETYLDIGELEYDETKAKTKATQGGLYKILDSKKSDELDLVDSNSLTGEDIGSINRISVLVDGRDILRISELNVADGTETRAVVSGGDNLNARTPPFAVETNSDRDHVSGNVTDQLSAASGTYATLSFDKLGNVFYFNADLDTELVINGRIEFRITNPQSGSISLDVVKYQNGPDVSNPYIFDNLANGNPGINGNVTAFDFVNYRIPILKGESVAFGVLSNTSDGIRYEWYNTSVEIREDSTFPPSSVNALTYKTLGERLVAKITGSRDCFQSSLMENGGIWEGHLVTQGFWAREFPDVIQEGTDEERKIQFRTSLKDFLDHLYAIMPIAWWVETQGNKEVLRVESLKYTQQNFIGIRYADITEDELGAKTTTYILPSSKVKRKTLKDNYYSTITLGSDKGGEDYEEVSGLQSISGKASWSTINNKSESKYEYLSPYRLGDIDVELARRRPFSEFPDVDTRYDSDLMVLDCQIIGNGYYLKKWQDSFETIPRNVYRVDTAFNLEFTPAQFLLNHSSEINVGLYQYSQENIHFASSNCNSSFISKKSGEAELREDAPMPHSRLDAPLIKPTSVDFDLEVSDELEEMIIGTTNGIPNWFGLVAVNTGEDIEYMRLVKVDTNKEGKHKLVEAFV